MRVMCACCSFSSWGGRGFLFCCSTFVFLRILFRGLFEAKLFFVLCGRFIGSLCVERTLFPRRKAAARRSIYIPVHDGIKW